MHFMWRPLRPMRVHFWHLIFQLYVGCKVSYTNLNRKWIHESCFWIFIESNFHSRHFLSVSICTFFRETRYNTSNTDCILQGDLSNSKSIWHLSLKFDALWCRVCSAKIRAIFPANYFSKPGVQINFSVMTNPRKLSLLCCRRLSRLTWRPEARRYSCNKIRKTQNEHLKSVCQNLNSQ